MDEVVQLVSAPIVEAVVDVDCDMPPQFDLLALEAAARAKWGGSYPEVKKRYVEHHQIQPRGDDPSEHVASRGIQALQFMCSDKAQLVQVRSAGYSFNRLAPYTSLDDYFLEIERTWKDFVEIAAPLQVRVVRLRYINRFCLPLTDGALNFDEFLTVGPQLPDQTNLNFTGFLNQYSAVEASTQARVAVVLTTQMPEGETLPLIFDITVEQDAIGAVQNWIGIKAVMENLRLLKNRVFHYTLTSRCKKLFDDPKM